MTLIKLKDTDLPDSGVKSVDTPDPHHNGELGFRGDVVVAMLAGVTGQTHFVVLSLAVLFNVLLGTLKDGGALGFGLSENKTKMR